MPFPTQTLGYPRIGPNRELKTALESFWNRKTDDAALGETFRVLRERAWRIQADAGIDLIAVGLESLYDPVLDWTLRLGLIPPRFRSLQGLERHFAMARGAENLPALDMTKWFDTNYHYIVPEISDTMRPQPDWSDLLDLLLHGRQTLGNRAVPALLGPLTYSLLAKSTLPPDRLLDLILPPYLELLQHLKPMAFTEIQFHEPALVLEGLSDLRPTVESAYSRLASVGIPINLVTFFDDLGENHPWVVALPAAVLTLDFTRGDTLGLLRQHPWPQNKTLAAGVVDGRNIWRLRPETVQPLLEELRHLVPSLRLSASCSLQFVPHSAAAETHLPEPLRAVLAFAEEKLLELRDLGQDRLPDAAPWRAFETFAPPDPQVRRRLDNLGPDDFRRSLPYAERRNLQVRLPPLPTTTIGSFPQTPELRSLRSRFLKGDISTKEYERRIDLLISHCIGVQEGLGLDMLVHGEFERTDMVEFFGQRLRGFAFTLNGWVQSFGSRCVRPPIIYADISRPAPMTVREFRLAQSLTHKPVKAMLTGPVTILNWSYSRTDIPRSLVACQIALCLRDEIADLEAAGAKAVQVDEPALREGLPLKRTRRAEYLGWAVDAFRLATAKAAPATQIHTHMCYSEFQDILDAIDRMDADVISIENARSGDAMLQALAAYGYPREVGPGVYDIHSPAIPSVDAIVAKLESFLKHLDPSRVWVNPDCGLKTRTWDEVIPSLRNMIEAARIVRNRL